MAILFNQMIPNHRGESQMQNSFTKSLGQNGSITAPATPEAQRWQGWGTALKPALEPITVARKPLSGTVAETVLQHGTGALNVDGCRVDANGENLNGGSTVGTHGAHEGWRRPWMDDPDHNARAAKQAKERVARAEALGRWPANLIHDGSDEVTGLFPETGAARQADRGKGIDGATFKHVNGQTSGVRGHNDAGGSAARFFYCAKASKRDRGESNKHPTVKPTALMRYLCKLITPPGGLVLDPFTGSGSTGRGAVLEGFRFVGMELDAEHIKEAKRRILEVQNGWTDEPEDEPVEDLPGQRLLF